MRERESLCVTHITGHDRKKLYTAMHAHAHRAYTLLKQACSLPTYEHDMPAWHKSETLEDGHGPVAPFNENGICWLIVFRLVI